MLRIVAFCVLSLTVTTMAYAGPPEFFQIRNLLDDLEAYVSALEAELIAPPSDNTDTLVDNAFEWSASTLEADPAIPPSDNTDWLGFWASPIGGEWADLEFWLARPVWVAHHKFAFGKRGFTQALGDTEKANLEAYTTLAPHAQLAIILRIEPMADGPRFSEVAAGLWDAELRQAARRLIDTGHEDAILRLWHEPELASKKWCDDPDYISAWRHVHDLFMFEPGAAFTWQYSVNGPAGRKQRSSDGTRWINKCYPGAAYVDQVSVGAYDRAGSTPDASWQSTLAKLVFVRDWALARGHRFSVAEWGLWHPTCSNRGQGDNPSFIQNSYDFFAAIPEESRGYLLYFNRHRCVDLDQYPTSNALFEELFGG